MAKSPRIIKNKKIKNDIESAAIITLFTADLYSILLLEFQSFVNIG